MVMTRRDFGKSAGTGLLLLATAGSSSMLVGCGTSSSSIFNEIAAWEPIGKSAVQGIITLLEGVGLIAPGMPLLISAILAGFDELIADVKAYQAMNPPPANALDRIVAVFNLIVGNFQDMLAQLMVSVNPIIATVIGLAQVILGTIAGFLANLPKAARLSGVFSVGREAVTYSAQLRSRKQFKHDFNSIAVAGGHPEIQLHVGFWEHF
jgi:hypothetical protein